MSRDQLAFLVIGAFALVIVAAVVAFIVLRRGEDRRRRQAAIRALPASVRYEPAARLIGVTPAGLPLPRDKARR